MGSATIHRKRRRPVIDWTKVTAMGFVTAVALVALVWIWVAKHHHHGVEAHSDASLGKGIDVLQFDPRRPRTAKGEGERLFLQAMPLYTSKKYAGAASKLREAELAAPEAAEIHLYLGLSFLMTSDTAAGTHELKLARSIGGPYLEDSRYYLAKGYLLSGDSADARLELEEVLSGNGPRARAAAGLMTQIVPPVVVPAESGQLTGNH